MKEYQITYKFSDVIDNIEAESQEEAQKIADERVSYKNLEEHPKKDTSCYDVEVEEIEDESHFFRCGDCGKEGLIEEWGFEDPEDDTCEGCKKFRKIRREKEALKDNSKDNNETPYKQD